MGYVVSTPRYHKIVTKTWKTGKGITRMVKVLLVNENKLECFKWQNCIGETAIHDAKAAK